jgi:hypothetical protein
MAEIRGNNGPYADKVLNTEFPSNSNKSKQRSSTEDTEKKEIKSIVSGPVIRKRKSLGKRFLETFFGDDTTNVGGYIIHDVLVPAAKSTVSDMITGGIEMLLFGERRRDDRRGRSGGYTSYSSYYNKRDDRRDRDITERRDAHKPSYSRHSYDEIILASRHEAKDVLDTLIDLVEEYGQASVADLYELVSITGNFTDNNYGWTDLRTASIRPVRGGYLVNLPKPVLIT